MTNKGKKSDVSTDGALSLCFGAHTLSHGARDRVREQAPIKTMKPIGCKPQKGKPQSLYSAIKTILRIERAADWGKCCNFAHSII